MGDDEVGVVDEDVMGVAAMKIPESPPMMNIETKESANSIEVVN